MSRERNIKSTKKSEKIESDHDDYTSAQKEKDVSVSKPSGVQTFAKIYYVLMPVLVVIIAGLLTFAVTRQETATIVKGTTKETGTGKGGKAKETPKKEVLLTAEELAKHDGSDPNIPVYLAILGRIYDVDKGRRHYEVGSGYNVFAGRDSTPSFVTGKFAREDATDDVKGLSPEDMMGVKGWLDFYRKDYTYVGKLIGRYYDSEGKPTEALQEAKALIKEGQRLQKLQDAENKRFPGCNSRWSKDEGSLVWCSENSAGINRDWVGVPRRMFKPGKKDPKCVCVKATGPSSDTGEGNEGDLNNPNMKLYPGCGKYDVSCKL
ncbi:unnamed protein product [Porites lobata]|uniref:Cytochrome b5 heme-binding domain-containing protein n=1 Tax=Porites lobata TaxID=104759 RepID=A0ABN8MXG0_9CNID|nr:unnamed protein product [Porites lobata]